MRAAVGEGSVVGVLAWVADEAGGEREVVAHGVFRKRVRRRSGMVSDGGRRSRWRRGATAVLRKMLLLWWQVLLASLLASVAGLCGLGAKC